jgi:hypothetical protein
MDENLPTPPAPAPTATPARSAFELLKLLDAQVDQQLLWARPRPPPRAHAASPGTPPAMSETLAPLSVPPPALNPIAFRRAPAAVFTTAQPPVAAPVPPGAVTLLLEAAPARHTPGRNRLAWLTASVCVSALAGITWTLVHAVGAARHTSVALPQAAPLVQHAPVPAPLPAATPPLEPASPAAAAPPAEPAGTTPCSGAAKALALCDQVPAQPQ